MSRRRAFHVVDEFEAALAEFTGAPYVVTVDSCTNAIFLALEYGAGDVVRLPKHTYVGVVQAARNAGYRVEFTDEKWAGFYRLEPTRVVDSAKYFQRGMYQPETFQCVSFQAGKLLPIGRGGAILTDDAEAADWFRKARLDGRTQGRDYQDNRYMGAGWHCYMTPPDAARGLWLLTYADDVDAMDWTEYPNLEAAQWV